MANKIQFNKEKIMDVIIKSTDCDFKMRVAGALIKNDKLLTVQICNNGFYCLPGGHIHLGESSQEAIVREFKEEVNVTASKATLMSVVENFFVNKKGKQVHEVCYFYIVETNAPIDTTDYLFTENDEGELKELEFKWTNLKELHNANFRPAILIDKFENKNFNFEHIIFNDIK